jgi:hypothetical protein
MISNVTLYIYFNRASILDSVTKLELYLDIDSGPALFREYNPQCYFVVSSVGTL